ncbi:DUF6531 domain-containing protein [Luteibacter sp. CQ10]|uniref:DUF6531 domain-containing protein n=1 Tax=Luteibacter sp. CQ10 TaxID=2805821 RepID=UPI0034A3BBBE
MPSRIATFILVSGTSLSAWSTDTKPFAEFAISDKIGDVPIAWIIDDSEAAVRALLKHRCDLAGYRDCQITSFSVYVWHTYGIRFSYLASDGNRHPDFTEDNWYHGCPESPSLYVIEMDGSEHGPYPNRTRFIEGPFAEKVVCRSSTPPPEPTEAEPHQSDLGPGDCLTHPSVGNPINAGLGNKFETATDIPTTAASALTWTRHYNSGAIAGDEPTRPMDAHLGARWRGTYDRSLSEVELDAGDSKRTAIRLFRATGERVDYVEANGRYASTVDPRGLLVRDGTGWRYRDAQGNTESYDANGRLITLDEGGTPLHFTYDATGRLSQAIDAQGRTLTFAYDAASRIASVRDGLIAGVTYTYDGTGPDADLVKATYADGTSVSYLYNEASHNGGTSQPHALTGIVDETHRRYASFAYDKDGRAISSEHALGTQKTSVRPLGTDRVQVTDADGAIRTYHYTDVRGGRRLTGLDQPGGVGCAASARAIEYDDGGNVAKLTDFDGRVTSFAHDADGRETERTDAFGTPQARTTRTE